MNTFFRGINAVFVALVLLASLTTVAQAQSNPNQGPEQDCFSALVVRQPVIVNQLPYTGAGFNSNEIPINTASCLQTPEQNSVWYQINVNADGQLGFALRPFDQTDLFNWGLYRVPSGAGISTVCGQLFSNPSLLVSCRTAPAFSGATGLLDTIGDNYRPRIAVKRGETYILYIGSNFAKAGFTLDLTGSSAGVIQNQPLTTKPTMSFVPIQSPKVNTCGQVTQFTVTFSQNVLCGSIQPSNFVLTGPGGPYTVTGAVSTLCTPSSGQVNDYTKSQTLTLTVSPALSQTGTYTLSTAANAPTPIRDVGYAPVLVTPTSTYITVGSAKPSINVSGTSVAIGSITEFCLGQSRTLVTDSLPSPGVTYRWYTVARNADGSTRVDEVKTLNNKSVNAPRLTVSSRYRQGDVSIPVGVESGLDSSLVYQQVDIPERFYRVEVTDIGGCVRTSDSLGLRVSSASVGAITIAQDPCRAFATLTVPSGSKRYRWFRDGVPITNVGAQGNSIAVSQTGTYAAEITLQSDCKNVASTGVTFDNTVTPPSVTGPERLCAGGAITLAIPSSEANSVPPRFVASSYQWFKDGVSIPGATNTSLVVTSPGRYAVQAVSAAKPNCPPLLADAKTVTASPTPPRPRLLGSSRTDSNGRKTADLACNRPVNLSVEFSQSDIQAAGLTQADIQSFTYRWTLNGVVLPGVTSATYQANQVGLYIVLAFNRDGCPSLAGDTIQVGGNNATTVSITPFTPTGTTVAISAGSVVICRGGSINLDAGTRSATGLYESWAWTRNGVAIPGPRGFQQVLTVTDAGSYSVTVIAAGCPATASINIIVQDPPTPVPEPDGGRTFFCEGDSLRLDGGLNPRTGREFDSYSWALMGNTQVLGTNRFYFAKAAGVYVVTVRDGGCAGTGASVPIRVELRPPTPSITSSSGRFAICPASALTLSVQAPPAGQTWTYQWKLNGSNIAAPNGTSRTLVVTQSGNYNVTITNAAGCSSTLPRDQAVTDLPAPTQPVITGAGVLCPGGSLTLTALDPSNMNRPYTSYQWFKDGARVSPGGTQQTLVVNAVGKYSVEVSNADSCKASSADGQGTVTPSALSVAIVTREFGAVFAVSANAAIRSIQWLLNNADIPGATRDTLQVRGAGVYAVRVTDVNGCTGSAPARAFSLPTVDPPGISTAVPNTSTPNVGSLTKDISAAPGDTVTFFIRFTGAGSLEPGAQLSAVLRFNATLLEPISSTPTGYVRDGVRNITVSFRLPSRLDTVQVPLPFRAALGNDSLTAVRLDSIRLAATNILISATSNSTPSIFRLKNISYAGGPRLIGPPPKVRLSSSHPNPTSDDVVIRYESSKETTVTAVVMDVRGVAVKTIDVGKVFAGTGDTTIPLGDVPQGVYYVVFRTADGERDAMRVVVAR